MILKQHLLQTKKKLVKHEHFSRHIHSRFWSHGRKRHLHETTACFRGFQRSRFSLFFFTCFPAVFRFPSKPQCFALLLVTTAELHDYLPSRGENVFFFVFFFLLLFVSSCVDCILHFRLKSDTASGKCPTPSHFVYDASRVRKWSCRMIT